VADLFLWCERLNAGRWYLLVTDTNPIVSTTRGPLSATAENTRVGTPKPLSASMLA
jgi:hypothetical protein